jgi:hypothetical protein
LILKVRPRPFVEAVAGNAMPGFAVFYSWQNDLPRDIARDFIHDAAEIAVGKVAQDVRLEDSPRLDHDTEGVSGVPAIGDTILAKIDQCGAFLADVSIVGESNVPGREKRYSPNPNVLLELGFAAARVGWERIILVMNRAFGSPQRLPFDLRYRRFPLAYRLRRGGDPVDAARQELAEDIGLGLRAVMDGEHQRVTDIIRRLDGYSLHLMRQHGANAYFWETGTDKFSITTQLNLAISSLLALGVIECVPLSQSPSGHAYSWTYMGRLCLMRLGFSLPPPAGPLPRPPVEPVVVDLSHYDRLMNEVNNADDARVDAECRAKTPDPQQVGANLPADKGA